MASKKVIFSTTLQDFRPILWYAEPVHTRYTQIKALLQEGLGDEYANFLAEPIISKEVLESGGKAMWMSDYVVNPQPFSSLSESQKQNARAVLQQIIDKIKRFSNNLKQDQDPKNREIADLLLQAIEVPGTEYIFVEDNKIVLVLWGFSSEESKKQKFHITKVVENTAPVIPPPPPPPIENKDEKIKIEKQIEDNNNLKNNNIQTNSVPPPPPPPPPIENKTEKRKGMPGWLWFLIGVLVTLLIVCIIWCLFFRSPQRSLLPDPGIIPPVDTTKLVTDPDDPAKRKVFSDRVNLALEKNTDIEAFAKKLYEKYPDLKIVFLDTTINLIQVQTPEGEWKQWKSKLKEFPEVKLAFSEALFQHGFVPQDPGFTDVQKNWYFNMVKAFEAWDITKGDSNIIVAVIDNGFDLTHPEIKDKIVSPWNVILHSNKVYPLSIEGGEHGTHVAGTAVGSANNGEGVCGIAPACKLMPIQIGDESGTLSSLAVVSGVLYAIHHGADVVNMSLGMYFDPSVTDLPEQQQQELINTLYPDEAQFWDELFEFAEEHKIVIVQAAGNQNILTGIDPFARTHRTLIVSAVAMQQNKADFSNYGNYSNISAPGVHIFNSVPGGFNYLDGTSMATPIVSGGVALIKSVHPEWSSQQIIDTIIATAIPVSSQKHIGPLIQLNKCVGAKQDSVMIIPENPEDLSFATGRWKSTTDLHSTIDNKKIELYFDINQDGTGNLTLVEEDGNKCFADLSVTFEDGKLVMVQDDKAMCQEDNKYYYPYIFECEQGENNVADCKAKEKNGGGDIIQFRMKRL